MADLINVVMQEALAVTCSPCSYCGLRYGSCAHTKDAKNAFTALHSVLEQIDKFHQPEHTQIGTRCHSCKDGVWPCATRRSIAQALQ